MDSTRRPGCIVMADDDPDDRELAREALVATGLKIPLYFVEDGDELLHFLRGNNLHRTHDAIPRTGLILLDLNMPRMDGREALITIKSDRELRTIPTVILSTSSDPEDILSSYALGANSFITKPVTFDGLVGVVRALCTYWFDTVALPVHGRLMTTR